MAFERAAELAPQNTSILEQIIDLDLRKSQFASARRRIDAEIEKDPKRADLHLLLAKVMLVAFLISAPVYLLFKRQEAKRLEAVK